MRAGGEDDLRETPIASRPGYVSRIEMGQKVVRCGSFKRLLFRYTSDT